MPDHIPFAQRGCALEDAYFRKKDQELVEKMRRTAAVEQAQRDMSQQIGLDDPEIVRELHALGFTAETVSLLPLMPLVQIASAEGGVTNIERERVLRLARTRGVVEGSAADRQFSDWLIHRPDPQVFALATRLTRALLEASTPVQPDLTADDLVKCCEDIASASGGVLRIKKIFSEERTVLATIAVALKTAKP